MKPRTLADLHALLARLDEPEPETDAFAFTPVPAVRARHDGWTPERQRKFIASLSQIGVVSTAAKSVGMSAKSAYALRRRATPESGFATAWDRARDHGRGTVDAYAIDRALEGVEEPMFYRGLQVGTRRRFNDGLLVAALHARGRPGFG